MVKKSNPSVIRKRIASDMLGRMLKGGESTSSSLDEELEGLDTGDLVQVAHDLKSLVKEGSAGAGVPLVKVMEYIDRRADYRRQGLAGEEASRICLQAIKELRVSGYKLYDAPEVVSAT